MDKVVVAHYTPLVGFGFLFGCLLSNIHLPLKLVKLFNMMRGSESFAISALWIFVYTLLVLQNDAAASSIRSDITDITIKLNDINGDVWAENEAKNQTQKLWTWKWYLLGPHKKNRSRSSAPGMKRKRENECRCIKAVHSSASCPFFNFHAAQYEWHKYQKKKLQWKFRTAKTSSAKSDSTHALFAVILTAMNVCGFDLPWESIRRVVQNLTSAEAGKFVQLYTKAFYSLSM